MRPSYAVHSWITVVVLAAIASAWPSDREQDTAQDGLRPATIAEPPAHEPAVGATGRDPLATRPHVDPSAVKPMWTP